MQADRFLCPIYNGLRNNKLFAVAFDGRDGSKWVTKTFFALFSSGPFELARRRGSTILPAFVIRGRNLTHKIVFELPFELSVDPDIEKALCTDTKQFAELFSVYRERYPCHSGWWLF